MKRQSAWKWGLVGTIGLSAWSLPIAGVLWRLRGREIKNKPVPLSHEATRPLILYTESWPTRARLDLAEIQGATEVSAGSLAPKTIASDLQRELAELGITVEPQRFETLPSDFDPGHYSPIVFIYSVRHRQLATEVVQFIDKRIEPWISLHGFGQPLALTDIAISETAGDSKGAQSTLSNAAQYYQIIYRPGPELYESTTWTQQEEMVRTQAQAIRDALATP